MSDPTVTPTPTDTRQDDEDDRDARQFDSDDGIARCGATHKDGNACWAHLDTEGSCPNADQHAVLAAVSAAAPDERALIQDRDALNAFARTLPPGGWALLILGCECPAIVARVEDGGRAYAEIRPVDLSPEDGDHHEHDTHGWLSTRALDYPVFVQHNPSAVASQQHGTVVAVRDLADHPGAEEPSVTQVTIDFEPTSAFHEGQRVALPAVTRTEWGVRYGSALPFVSDERVAAEGFLEVRAPGGHLVRREVTAWTVVDGSWGPQTTRALQRVLGTPVDGVIPGQYPNAVTRAIPACDFSTRGGSTVIRALQRRLGVPADGYIGPETVSALQRYLGTPVDGVVSRPRSLMVEALQRRLNTGRL